MQSPSRVEAASVPPDPTQRKVVPSGQDHHQSNRGRRTGRTGRPRPNGERGRKAARITIESVFEVGPGPHRKHIGPSPNRGQGGGLRYRP